MVNVSPWKRLRGIFNTPVRTPKWMMKGRGRAWYKKKRVQLRYDGLQKAFPRFQSGGRRFPTIAGKPLREWNQKKRIRRGRRT